MTDNELLIAISDMMDNKLKPLNENVKDIELTLENELLPRLQNIESCYTSTYRRYKVGVERIDEIKMDVDVLKNVVAEHSEKLQRIS